MQPFPARYAGHCDPCDDEIKPGEFIIAHPDAGFIHEECAEYVGKAPESNGADSNSFNRGRAPITVLPRGKTAKDRCNKCFIVHATNQTECEW